MKERLIELIGSKICEDYSPTCDEYSPHTCSKCYANDCKIGDLADAILADCWMRPPCKVGDIVYQTDGVRIYELTILDISLHKNKPYYETEDIDFDDDAIGESIFLTREEAEKALRKEDEGK